MENSLLKTAAAIVIGVGFIFPEHRPGGKGKAALLVDLRLDIC